MLFINPNNSSQEWIKIKGNKLDMLPHIDKWVVTMDKDGFYICKLEQDPETQKLIWQEQDGYRWQLTDFTAWFRIPERPL